MLIVIKERKLIINFRYKYSEIKINQIKYFPVFVFNNFKLFSHFHIIFSALCKDINNCFVNKISVFALLLTEQGIIIELVSLCISV